jgi:hypothetical protein
MNTYKPAPESLKQAIREFMAINRGKLYAPLPHPDFKDWPCSRSTERFDIIAPHLDAKGGTALDIGTHFGTFAQWLESKDYRVTAIESSNKYYKIAQELRDLCDARFMLLRGSALELEDCKYDVVLALNIFHHFLKTKEKFVQFTDFLGRLQCQTLFFQSHVAAERQMDKAYVNFEQKEFAAFISDKAKLPVVTIIGHEGPRNIFKLSVR